MNILGKIFSLENSNISQNYSAFDKLLNFNVNIYQNKRNKNLENVCKSIINNKLLIFDKYQQELKSEKTMKRYPNMQEFIKNDDQYLYVNNDFKIHPIFENVRGYNPYIIIDDMTMTLSHMFAHMNENGSKLEYMNKESQLMFKQLFVMLLMKAQTENKLMDSNYYGYTPRNYYHREDLIKEISYMIYGKTYDDLEYILNKQSILELVRIYLQRFYFTDVVGSYDLMKDSPFANMKFEVITVKHVDGYSVGVPLMEPVLKVTYNDEDDEIIQIHGNYKLAYDYSKEH